MIRMALRPRWIAALLLALGVAATCAGLAQWQINSAVTNAIVQARPTETVQPIASVLQPGVATPQSATGQRFRAEGAFQIDDTVIVANRVQNVGDQSSGWWVVGHFITSDNIDLPVVIGWAPTETDAQNAEASFDAQVSSNATPTQVTGRFLPSDAPEVPENGSTELRSVSVAQLVNVWQSVASGGAYFGYLISEQPQVDLAAVSTPAPEQQTQLNWLNVFYGIEWAVFGGFAIYLWWRLVRDADAREREAQSRAD